MSASMAAPMAVKSSDSISFGKRLMAKFAAGMAHRQTAKALNELDDRMLADIGINRGDIYEIAARNAVEVEQRFIGRAA